MAGRLMLNVLIAGALSLSHQASASPSDPLEPGLSTDQLYEVSDRSWGKANDYSSAVERQELPARTNAALNAIVRFAAFKLKAKGYKSKSRRLIYEWEHQYGNYLVARDLGDHAPLSKWLADQVNMLELILGTDVMKWTRLYDLKVINYALPMVFKCLDHADEVEFGKHFIPLSGVVVYWTTFFVCVGGTWGTGFIFCGPLAMGTEFLTTHFVAPKLNPIVWKWSCKPADGGVLLPEFVPYSNGGYNASLVNKPTD